MKNYDEQISFEQGGDSGENNAESTQPYTAGDIVEPAVLNRVPENLRVRSETLRRAVEHLLYMADYDRAFSLKSNATFTCVEPDNVGDPGAYALTMTGDDLLIYPTLSPGLQSGGRDRGAKLFTQQGLSWLPYAGTAGVNDLVVVASAQYTGQRGYADAEDFAVDTLGVSLGANRLRLSIVANPALAGGIGTITAAITGDPKVQVTITIGTLTPTTVADVVSFINNDATSQGSYGLRHLFRASTTGPGTTAAPTFLDGTFQGGYDAEAHKITPATLAAFFAASVSGAYPNRLREGDGLALAYTLGPVESGVAGAKGGRRQAVHDWASSRTGANSDNTAPTSGWRLFNTAREPEKIPGSIPVGKLLNGRFVMIDGTNVGAEAIGLTESYRTLARLLDTGVTPGASLVGYGGSGGWHSDAAAADVPNIPASTLEVALDTIINQLSNSASGQSGSRRLGAEAISGTASALNVAMSLLAGSIRQQISALLNTPATTTNPGGVNARVSEQGHTLKGPNPITKDLSNISIANPGAQRFSALLSSAPLQTNAAPNYSARQEFADLIVQPLGAITSGATPVLLAAETVAAGSTSARLLLTGASIATRYAALQSLFPTSNVYSELYPATKSFAGTIIVALFGSVKTTGDGDGYYFFEKFTNAVTHEMQLCRLDGTAADFTGTTFGSAFVLFCNTSIVGNDPASHRRKSYHMSEYAAEDVSVLGSTGVPWKETYHANITSVGADAIKGSAHFADKSQWRPSTAKVRDTDHIPIASDYAAIAGNDLGAMTDATSAGSHHHDNTIGVHVLTGGDIHLQLSAYDSLTEALIAANPTFAQITAAGGPPQPAASVLFQVPPAAIPAGLVVGALIVEVTHLLTAASGSAGMVPLNASFTLAGGSTDPYSGGAGSFAAPAGSALRSSRPRAVLYRDGTATQPSITHTTTHVVPVGNYFYNNGGLNPLIAGTLWLRYADNGFSGDAAVSRVDVRLIGFVKTR